MLEILKWSKEEKNKKEMELAYIVQLLKGIAKRKYGEDNISLLRKEQKLEKEEEIPLKRLEVLEDQFWRAYYLMIQKISNYYWTRNRKFGDGEDFLDETFLSFLNCMQNFTGEAAFITYLNVSVRNALLAFVIERKKHFDRIDLADLENVEEKKEQITPRVELLKLALKKVALTDMEKRLVQGRLEGNRKLVMEISKNEIHPRTGRLWTKQALSLCFKRGCDKLKLYIESCEREAA